MKAMRLRVRASSLNFHDYVVVTGGIQADDGRIPMSDGGGEVLEVGEGVSTLAVGDTVCSTFFPDWTAGRGVDHVVEVGGAGNVEQSIAACAMGGHIALLGVLAGHAAPISTARLMASQIRLQGLMVGNREQQLQMIRAIDASGIRPVIDTQFPLEALADVFHHQASNHHFGKICIAV